MNALHELLEQGCQKIGIVLGKEVIDKLIAYIVLLEKWNRVFNLTGVKDKRSMVVRHLLDSLVVLPYIKKMPILDVGTGAGLPGIPLALSLPKSEWVLLECNHKKIHFLQQVLSELSITNVKVVCTRIEMFYPHTLFGTVISRAFSSAFEMVEKTRRMCAKGGCWLLMKGRYDEDEFKKLATAFVIHKLTVPELVEERHLGVVQSLNTEG